MSYVTHLGTTTKRRYQMQRQADQQKQQEPSLFANLTTDNSGPEYSAADQARLEQLQSVQNLMKPEASDECSANGQVSGGQPSVEIAPENAGWYLAETAPHGPENDGWSMAETAPNGP
ncbi:unnamed protein product [Clonostachys rosea f. rosea IK726]|uniref:Uncharacterized protein n=1 Tax=Clonostachys rosea f. rosea IK726 TaxID=1349383 RepID=A0ACA9TAR8_BIOOC|nr:unnamed protein product [Clonostachys rosea f. rosea IK726]